jgi:hypothetical protein
MARRTSRQREEVMNRIINAGLTAPFDFLF